MAPALPDGAKTPNDHRDVRACPPRRDIGLIAQNPKLWRNREREQ
jgi:hypothetical protein